MRNGMENNEEHKLKVTSKMNETECVIKNIQKHMGTMADGGHYLMLRDLIFQLRRLRADGFRVDQVFLCGSEPLAQRLQGLVELLSHH